MAMALWVTKLVISKLPARLRIAGMARWEPNSHVQITKKKVAFPAGAGCEFTCRQTFKANKTSST